MREGQGREASAWDKNRLIEVLRFSVQGKKPACNTLLDT